MRPILQSPKTILERLDHLEGRSILVPHQGRRIPFGPVTYRPGALDRFLAEREDLGPEDKGQAVSARK